LLQPRSLHNLSSTGSFSGAAAVLPSQADHGEGLSPDGCHSLATWCQGDHHVSPPLRYDRLSAYRPYSLLSILFFFKDVLQVLLCMDF
jgi:hypothetical protein